MVTKRSKNNEKVLEGYSSGTFEEALVLLKKCQETKFDQSIELSVKLGVDPKKSDQQVRGTVLLPHGTGKKLSVLVIAKGEKVNEALEAGADFAGHDELIEKIKGGWTGFDAVVATPEMMREVGKLGKILGPRGLMPTPKAGTVTMDVAKAVEGIKKGQIEFKVDKSGVVNLMVGKLSFLDEHLTENIRTVMHALQRAKPTTAKGVYIKSLFLSSSMGPGLSINIQSIGIG